MMSNSITTAPSCGPSDLPDDITPWLQGSASVSPSPWSKTSSRSRSGSSSSTANLGTRRGGGRRAESAARKLVLKEERGGEGGSNHHKALRSWEADLALGAKARHGPILYAMDKLQDKLNNDDCKHVGVDLTG